VFQDGTEERLSSTSRVDKPSVRRRWSRPPRTHRPLREQWPARSSRRAPIALDQSSTSLSSVRRDACSPRRLPPADPSTPPRTHVDRRDDKVHRRHPCSADVRRPLRARHADPPEPPTTDLPPPQYTFLWLPCIRFQVLFTLISKFFASFAHATYLLSVSRRIFSFGWSLPPCFMLESQRTWLVRPQTGGRCVPSVRGCHPLRRLFPKDLSRLAPRRLQSPKLQFPAKGFQIWALPASLAVTEGILVSFFSSR